MSKLINYRFGKDGLVLAAQGGAEFDEFMSEFMELIDKSPTFFAGARIIGIEGISLSHSEKTRFEDYVRQYDFIELVSLGDWVDDSKKNTDKLQAGKIEKRSSDIKPAIGFGQDIRKARIKRELDFIFGSEETMAESVFYRGTVRSGVKLESEAHIIVVGDVNPGAELIAKGNIVVMGMMRGLAHAGSTGDETCIIAAWKLKPTQIRIADYITMPPEDDEDDVSYPEMAVVVEGRVLIKSYQ